MVSSPSLRSCRRGKLVYSIGDKVEVVRTRGLDTGKIKQEAPGNNSSKSGSAVVLRWIVAFDDGSEEEISEKGLGRIIDDVDSEESTNSLKQPTARMTSNMDITNGKSRRSHTGGGGGGQKHEPGKAYHTAKKKTQVQKVNQEARLQQGGNGIQTRAVRKRDGSEILHTGIEVARKKTNSKRTKGNKTQQGKPSVIGETVTTVKLLTGTLYLYRGPRPRAEFIRFV